MSTPSTPKKITWIIGLASGILGIIGHYVNVQILTEYNYGLLLVGFAVLAAGTTFRELRNSISLMKKPALKIRSGLSLDL